MGKPKAPAPPDPRDTSAAQTGTNIGTAVANNNMQLVDQYTPDGSLTYSQTGSYSYEDPYTKQTYDIPKWAATTTLSPENQYLLDANMATKANLADTATERSEFLKDYLPKAGAATDAIDEKISGWATERLDPWWASQEDAVRTRLANQGIVPGSEAYNKELQQFYQGRNDAYNQAYLTSRGQAASEVNMPINQVTALMSGSQVSNPNVMMQQPQGAATTDVAGLINQNYNQRLQGWQQQNANRQSLLGGLFGLGAGGLAGGWFNGGVYH